MILSSSDGITLTQGAIIDASCTGCSDGTAVVVASGGTGSYTYMWDDPSITTTSVLTNAAAGVYCVTATDGNNCTDVTCMSISQPISIGELSDTDFQIYSFGSDVTIKSTGSANLEIDDLQGRQVARKRINRGTHNMRVGNGKGIYLVRIANKNGVLTKKVFID